MHGVASVLQNDEGVQLLAIIRTLDWLTRLCQACIINDELATAQNTWEGNLPLIIYRLIIKYLNCLKLSLGFRNVGGDLHEYLEFVVMHVLRLIIPMMLSCLHLLLDEKPVRK